MLLSVVILCHLWTCEFLRARLCPTSVHPFCIKGKTHRKEGETKQSSCWESDHTPSSHPRTKTGFKPSGIWEASFLLPSSPPASFLPVPTSNCTWRDTHLSSHSTTEGYRRMTCSRSPVSVWRPRSCLGNPSGPAWVTANMNTSECRACCVGFWNGVVLSYRCFSDDTGGALETFPCWVLKSPCSPIPHLCLQLASPSAPPYCLSKTLASWLCLK